MLAPWAEQEGKRAIYHVMSHVIDRQFVLGPEEKETFVRMMRQYEAFCGVKVLTYCVMSNHFHILVEVPPKSSFVTSHWGDEEFVARLEKMYSPAFVEEVVQEIRRIRTGENYAWESEEQMEAAVTKVKERFSYRFNDLGEFMKALKQRFTQWFNRRNGRKGTLWEERYKSVIVESGLACRTMAAYIDLNPVRAKIVDDANEYRWCGYAEADAGKRVARAGLQRVMDEREACVRGRGVPAKEALVVYRRLMIGDTFQKGLNGRRTDEEEAAVAAADLEWNEKLNCRVRYFTDGAVIGSKAFVNEAFFGMRERFGEKRKDGARRMRGLPKSLFSLRDLVVTPVRRL